MLQQTATIAGIAAQRKQSQEKASRLEPRNREEESLCKAILQNHSSVILLSGAHGYGKSTQIPAVVFKALEGRSPAMVMVAQTNILATTSNVDWMNSKTGNKLFANGLVAGKVGFVGTQYLKSGYGESFPIT